MAGTCAEKLSSPSVCWNRLSCFVGWTQLCKTHDLVDLLQVLISALALPCLGAFPIFAQNKWLIWNLCVRLSHPLHLYAAQGFVPGKALLNLHVRSTCVCVCVCDVLSHCTAVLTNECFAFPSKPCLRHRVQCTGQVSRIEKVSANPQGITSSL